MNNVKPTVFLSYQWNWACYGMEYGMYSNDALQQSTNIKARKYGSVWKWNTGFRWAEGKWIILGFGNEMLCEFYGQAVEIFRGRSRHTFCYMFNASSEERNGWFIPGLLCSAEFSSVPLLWETASNYTSKSQCSLTLLKAVSLGTLFTLIK